MQRFALAGAVLMLAPWGVVAPGAIADLIAVAGNPLADVNVLKSVQFVMKDGAVFKSPPIAAPAP